MNEKCSCSIVSVSVFDSVNGVPIWTSVAAI